MLATSRARCSHYDVRSDYLYFEPTDLVAAYVEVNVRPASTKASGVPHSCQVLTARAIWRICTQCHPQNGWHAINRECKGKAQTIYGQRCHSVYFHSCQLRTCIVLGDALFRKTITKHSEHGEMLHCRRNQEQDCANSYKKEKGQPPSSTDIGLSEQVTTHTARHQIVPFLARSMY